MNGLTVYEQHLANNAMDDLIHEHGMLVSKIAKKLKRKLPSHIEFDDLLQSGYVGLIEASKTFKQDGGASFETFACIRIKGAILDFLRKNSWNNREAIKSLKQMGDAVHRVEQRKQGQATAEEVAAEMNISVEEHNKLCQKINLCNMINIDAIEDINVQDDELDPEAIVTDDDIKERIKDILGSLPERERILLSLYYVEELTFREIGEVLNLTEARVSQIHALGLAKIKKRLSA